MPEIQFKRGEFLTFRATTKFHLGEKQKDIWDGDEIEFDGQTVKYQGESFGAPSIRGAIKAGWLVLASDNVSKYIPKAAGVVIHKAQSTGRERGAPIKMGSTQDEEQEVGLVKAHQERVKTALDQSTAPRPRVVVAAPAPAEPPEDESSVLREILKPKAADAVSLIDEMTEEELALLSEDELVALGMSEPEPEPVATQSPPAGTPRPRNPAEAEEYNRAILAKALAVDVPKPKDPNQAYGGARHDTTGDEKARPSKPGETKKFVYQAAADDQGGQVVRKIQTSAPGVSVGAEGVRGLTSTTNVSKVSAKNVEASVKPIGGGKRPQLPDPSTLTAAADVDPVATRTAKIAAARAIVAARTKALVTAAEATQAAEKPKVVVIESGGITATGAVTLPDKLPEERDFEPVIPRGTATQVTEGESLAAKPSGTTGDVREMRAGDDLADLLPDALVAGMKPPGSIVGQDFNGFSWDTHIHWAKRVDLAVKNYGDQPEALKQILAAETPHVVKSIQSRMLKLGKPL